MCGSDPCLTSKDDSATADDFSEWTDFPKGMRVLLLDHDDLSASTISSELQQMDYTVTRFRNEDEALEAVAIKTEAFHVAIVEVNTSKSHESFRFLQMARGLPTIMISDVQCLNTMMKCIALGAAAFLEKPLSEDKLRNIWQYVVHKAFNARQDGLLSKSLKPIKETVWSMLRLQSDEPIPQVENRKNSSQQNAGDDDDKVTKRMFATAAAPSNPQQTSHSLDARDVQAQAMDDHQDTLPVEANPEETSTVIEAIKTDDASSDHHRSSDCKSKKKPMKKERKLAKVDWTPELHRRFIQAVEQLGIYEAIPSKILEHMKVEGLTRHNVASHLQKYRMHRRHVLPQQQRKQQQHHVSKFYLQNPCVAFPPNYHHQVHHHHLQSSSPVWGHPAYNHQTWLPHDTARYQPSSPRIWPWKSFTRMYADNWGFPVPGDNMFSTQHKFGRNRFYGVRVEEQKRLPPRNLYDDLYVEEEVIDEVVKEAMRKPWLPLPLGLKPPSVDAVLAELQRQGIRAIPPRY